MYRVRLLFLLLLDHYILCFLLMMKKLEVFDVFKK